MDPARIAHVAEVIQNSLKKEEVQIAVVVSAMGHTTDKLLELAQTLSHHPDSRELDLLMSTGEMISATLLTIALQALGINAKSFTGSSAGIITDKQFGSAKIKSINTQELESCLQAGIVPVVAGFQGVSEDGEVTTLGRGGSDTTGIALAAALHADCCDIFTDVAGVYSADPRIVHDAHKIETITYRQMHELALSGAQVLNARSVETAMLNNVPIRVRSTFQPDDEGTLVCSASESREKVPTGIASDALFDAVSIKLAEPSDSIINLREYRKQHYDTKVKLLGLLKKAGIQIERGSAFIDARRIAFLVNKSDSDRLQFILKEAGIPRANVDINKSLVRISVVSHQFDADLESSSTRALTQSNIPIELVTKHLNRISFMVDESQKNEAIKTLHQTLTAVTVAA